MASPKAPLPLTAYKVGVMRSRGPGPVRWLTLELEKPEGEIKHVSVFFYEKDPGDRGFVNRETGFVVANLPVADYQPMYHILQTEKPVFVTWRTETGEDALLSIDVSTSEEPIGEGFVDQS
jgi:hypothetical protein